MGSPFAVRFACAACRLLGTLVVPYRFCNFFFQRLVNLFRWLAQRWALESTLENFFQQWLAAKFSMILLIFDASATIS